MKTVRKMHMKLNRKGREAIKFEPEPLQRDIM